MAKQRKNKIQRQIQSFIIYPAPTRANKYEAVSGILTIPAIILAIMNHSISISPNNADNVGAGLATDLYTMLAIALALIAIVLYLRNINRSEDAFRHRDNFVSLCLLIVMVISFVLLRL